MSRRSCLETIEERGFEAMLLILMVEVGWICRLLKMLGQCLFEGAITDQSLICWDR